MSRHNLPDLLEHVRTIARGAGAAIEATRQGQADVQAKDDGSPVTAADRASHTHIAGALARLTPDIPLISEEGDQDRVASPELFWLVDPLDGTKEFIKGFGEYTVNIALVDAGEPVLGAVYAPARDKMYYAARGIGAFVQTGSEPARGIAPAADGPLKAAISRSHASEETTQLLERLGVSEVVRMGSSLKLCAVADGTVDVYPRLGPTYLWDTSAAAAVVRAAGAQVYTLEGEPVSYRPVGDLKLRGFIVCAGEQGRIDIDAVVNGSDGVEGQS